MKLISPEEYIYVDTWQKIADSNKNILFCKTDNVRDVLSSIKKRVFLLSAYSDACICHQESNHPNSDLLSAALAGIDWNNVVNEKNQYIDINLDCPCDKSRCSPKDRYISKSERWSFCTFPFIPENIRHWYTTNLNIKHDKLSWIPFGVNSDNNYEIKGLLSEFSTTNKTKTLYVNFSGNTLQRQKLKQHFSCLNWCTYQEDIAVKEYIREMAKHRFVLCPGGNGLDCFRTYEALYLGCIPIIEKTEFANYLVKAGLPVLVVNSLQSLTGEFLIQAYEQMRKECFTFSKITLSYWSNLLKI